MGGRPMHGGSDRSSSITSSTIIIIFYFHFFKCYENKGCTLYIRCQRGSVILLWVLGSVNCHPGLVVQSTPCGPFLFLKWMHAWEDAWVHESSIVCRELHHVDLYILINFRLQISYNFIFILSWSSSSSIVCINIPPYHIESSLSYSSNHALLTMPANYLSKKNLHKTK